MRGDQNNGSVQTLSGQFEEVEGVEIFFFSGFFYGIWLAQATRRTKKIQALFVCF